MKTKKLIELRAVEAYFLLCFAKQEQWSMVHALTAVLAELYERDLIALSATNPGALVIRCDLRHDEDCNNLRSYERAFLEAIKCKDLNKMFDAVDDFRFKHFLTKKGLLEKRKWHAPFMFKSTVLSKDGADYLRLLKEDKENLKIEAPSVLSVISIFPSADRGHALIAHFRSYATEAALAAIKRHAEISLDLSPMHAILL